MDFIVCSIFAVKERIQLYFISIFHVRRTKFQKSNIRRRDTQLSFIFIFFQSAYYRVSVSMRYVDTRRLFGGGAFYLAIMGGRRRLRGPD